MRKLALGLLALAVPNLAHAQGGPVPPPGIPLRYLGAANGVPMTDGNNYVLLGNESPSVAVPPAATLNAPSLFADFATRNYAASISGRLYPQPLDGVMWGAGPAAGGYYIDPSSTGRIAIAGGSRFTFDTVSKAKTGILVEPASTNLVPDPVGYTSGWNGGADTQGKLNTDLPALFPGVGIVKHIRDSNPTSNSGGWGSMPMPAVNGAFTSGVWFNIPKGSTASEVCVNGSNAAGITGVGSSAACADLNVTNVWQFSASTFGKLAAGTAMALITNVTGPSGAIAYTTGYTVSAGRLPLSFTGTPRTTPDSLVASGAGLENTASGTLLLRGFYIGGSNNPGDLSGGITFTDGTASNVVSLELIGSITNPTLQGSVTVGGTNVLLTTGGAPARGTFYTAAISWGNGVINYADSVGGTGTVTASTPTGLTQLGALPGVNPISRLIFYQTPMTQAQLQALVGTGLDVTASADQTSPGLTVPLNFVGTSWEMNDSLFNHQWQAGAGATSLAALINRLGNGIIRVGGNSSDSTYVPTPDRIAELTGFMASVPNNGLIFGLNLCANTPSAQATIGQEIITGYPAAVIQFGNEPDSYPATCARAGNNYGPSNYLTDWATYLTALQAVAPSAAVAGPDIASTDSWLSPFLAAEGANIGQLTRHNYALCPNTDPTDSILTLLMTDRLYPKTTAPADVALAASFNKTIRMTETNSICAGGLTGISNVLASATWAVPYMMQLSSAGFAGVDFHSGRVASLFYTPFIQNEDLTYSPQPLYYAMLMFAQVEGMRLIPTTSSSPFTTMPVQAYLDSGGSVWYLAVNKNQTQPALLTINQTGPWTQQSVMFMTGTSPTATAVTLGGASVDNGGNWNPSAALVPKGQPISIPPSSAALIKLQ